MATKTSFKTHTRVSRLVIDGKQYFQDDQIKCYKERIGIEQPFWKTLIALRLNAATPLTGFVQSLVFKPGYLQFNNYRGYQSSDRGGMPYSVVVGAVPTWGYDSAADQKAKQDFYKQLNAIRRDFSGQQAIGEYRQTLNLLKNPVKEAFVLLKSFMSIRNHERTGKRKAGAIGSQWLQVRFGLLPLASDCAGLVSTLKRQLQQDDVRTYKAFGKAETSSIERRDYADIYGCSIGCDIIRTVKSKVYYTFGHKTVLKSEADARMDGIREAFFKLEDIPATLWEVMPWSWLVDYFLNVGAIIEALSTSTKDVVYVSKSVITESSVTFQSTCTIPIGGAVVTGYTPMSATFLNRKVTRTPEFPGIPSLTVGLPRSPIQLANMAAILLQLLKNQK